MPTVYIPALLRHWTNQKDHVTVPGATVGEIVDALEAQFPGIKARLCDGGQIRPGLAVVIDTQVAHGGLSEAVSAESEMHFIPAIAGGNRS